MTSKEYKKRAKAIITAILEKRLLNEIAIKLLENRAKQ